MQLIFGIVIFYLLLMVGIGVYGRKHARNFKDYLTTGRRATMLMIMGSAIGAHIGSGFVVGGAEAGATFGIAGAWYGIGCGLSYIIVGLALSKFTYSSGYVTISDYFKDRYGGNTTRLIYSIATPISASCSLAAQIAAGASIFVAFGVNGTWGAIIATSVVIFYSCVSGLWGAYMTSVIQTGIIVAGLLFGGIFIYTQGAGQVFAALPQGSFQLLPFNSAIWVSMVIPTITAAFVDQSVFQRLGSAVNQKASKWGHVAGGLLLIPVAFLPPLIGVYGQAIFPDAASSTVFWKVVVERMPVALSGLVVAAVLAAVMSTCDIIFLAISACLVHDVYKGMIKPDADDKRCQQIAVGLNIIAGAFAMLVALRLNNIISILSISYTVISAGCLIPFLAGILWKRGNQAGAIASAIAGIAVALASTFGLFSLPFDILSLLAALIAYIVVSLLAAKPPAAKLPASKPQAVT